MRQKALAAWNALPAPLAWALAAYQVAIPWLVPYFATQDGPSHVYNATIFWDLVLHHKTSIYSPLYTAQHYPLPNWTGTIVLAFLRALVGSMSCERVFVTLAFLAGFVAWSYSLRALGEKAWTPVANFLYQTWFLWIGFFDFYLGIALLPLAIAVYVHKEGWLDLRRAGLLALTLLAIYLTHVIAAVVALITVLSLGFWVHIAVPVLSGEAPPRSRIRQFGWLLLAAAPVILLMLEFVAGADTRLKFNPEIAVAWQTFPQHIFATARNWQLQPLLWKALLVYAGLAVVLLKKREWLSPKGGLVLASLLVFTVYLLVPDKGLGGSEAKIRFSWAFFILAGLVACSASRLRLLRVPVALLFVCFGCINSIATQRTAESISHAAKDYLDVAGRIAPHASLVRLRYHTPQLPAAYGFEGSGRDPLFHLDALAAAQRHALDLSDYEAISTAFPVVYKSDVDAGMQSGLWSFEGPDQEAGNILRWLDANFTVPIDYVMVVGDPPSPLDYLDSTMKLVAISPNRAFRLYRRLSPRTPADSPVSAR